MSWWDDIRHFGGNLWQGLVNLPSNVKSWGVDAWRFTNKVAQGFDYFVTHPMESAIGTLQVIAELVTGNLRAANQTAGRLEGFIGQTVGGATRAFVIRLYRQLAVALDQTQAQLAAAIARRYRQALDYARVQVRHEVRARQRAIALLRAQMLRSIRATHQQIEREAASAYDAQLPDRLSAVTRLAELLAGRQPELRGAVSLVTRAVVDLLGVDDPLARLALGFALRELVSKSAVDQPIAALVRDLASPLLGEPKPKDLHDVISQIAQRLEALEGWQSTFMQDGGPEILQAGKDWSAITGVAIDAALLSFFGTMTADPVAWARDVSAVAGAPLNDAIMASANLLSRL